MEMVKCTICLKNKTAITCHHCNNATCKHCSYFVDENSFEFQSLLPEHLQDKTYCPSCYHEHIDSELESYNDVLQKAKEVNVYTKIQSSETRLIKRTEKPIKIENCNDREETLLRLAFLAVQKGYSTIVDVDITSQKSGKGGSYKSQIWNGTAIPVGDKNISSYK